MKQSFLLLFTSILLLSCDKLPELNGFDREAWVLDLDGCENNRLALIDTILVQQDKLKGLGQNQVIEILGKADQHELYERSQKFFIYHLQPGRNCANYTGKYFKAFYIRFNSLNQAVDFTIQEVN
ncbi:MAG: hypothetical protein ACI9XJ_002042 [Marivirga sp.]|jgi:hypothetical protein